MTRGTGLRVFLLTFLVYAYFMPQWADWNIDSRIDLTHAIVSQGSLRIDKYHFNTWDKAKYRGHFYSDKAPGTALLGVPVLAAFYGAKHVPILSQGISALEGNRAWQIPIQIGQTSTQKSPGPKGRILGGCQRAGVAGNVQYIPWGNRLVPPMRDWALSKYVVTVGVVSLLSSLFAVFFFWFLGVFGLSAPYRWAGTLLLAFATSALPYSSNFYSHQLAGAYLFTAFALLYLCSRGGSRWLAAAAGFLVGFALLTEYTVAIIVVLIAVYVVWIFRRRLWTIVSAAVGGIPPLLGLGWYNAAAFGSPLDSGYSHDFCWSSAQAGGFQGFTYPHLGPLFDLTIGTFRGLFFLSPFLLLAIPGIILLARRGYRAEAAACGVSSAVFILALSSYWGWNGGQVDGPRYLVPVIPFLAFPASVSLPWLWRELWSRLLVIVVALWSVFATWALFLGGPTFPKSWLRNPLFQYSLPALARGDITSNAGLFFGLRGWPSLIPLAVVVCAIAVWIVVPSPKRTSETAARPVRAASGQ